MVWSEDLSMSAHVRECNEENRFERQKFIKAFTPCYTHFTENMEDINNENSMVLPDVIILNVGGVLYTTSKATLLRDQSSMLAALFSGRYKIPTDQHGHFFIDRDGSNFSFILNYLRGEDCQPPPHLAVKILEEAEYFQIHGLIEGLQVYPSVFQAKLLKRIDEKFQTQFWQREIVMKSQSSCLESLSSSSCISFTNDESIELLTEEPSCVGSQHSIQVTKFTENGPKHRTETFYELENRMKNIDCVVKNVRTKDMKLFVSSLQRRLDEDKYAYHLTQETASCNAEIGYKSKSICDFSVTCFNIQFFWDTGPFGKSGNDKVNK